jgi:hypothetical protein
MTQPSCFEAVVRWTAIFLLGLSAWVIRLPQCAAQIERGTGISDARRGDWKTQVVLSVFFTEDIRQTHRLLHPPKNLHPWLKWLLYSGRIQRQKMRDYDAVLKKRDRIYQQAVGHPDRFGILYQGKIFESIPLYVTPDWGDGEYALVLRRLPGSETQRLTQKVS